MVEPPELLVRLALKVQSETLDYQAQAVFQEMQAILEHKDLEVKTVHQVPMEVLAQLGPLVSLVRVAQRATLVSLGSQELPDSQDQLVSKVHRVAPDSGETLDRPVVQVRQVEQVHRVSKVYRVLQEHLGSLA